MLETAHRDGRARILDWTVGDRQVATPTLIVPRTRRFAVPAWADVVVTAAPNGASDADPVELVSGGTWFHPTDATGPLVVPAPRPAPTDKVQVVLVGDEVAVWHDAGGWASNPRNGVPALIQAHKEATPGRILWAPGLGTPADYAVWAYLGVDAFDASPLLLAAVRGTALTVDGPVPKAEAEALHNGGAVWTTEELAIFNLEEARRELHRIRTAIRDGSLRALAERRCYATPGSVELLRRCDREYGYLEAATPVHKTTPVPCMTQESLWMPEVERFRRRFQEDYQPPAGADILVLLPCSATKPYRRSPSHRWFQRALDDSGQRDRVHEVMVTSPLGLVPRELEEVYPADRYDVPVTGHWNRDEEAIIRAQMAALLDKREYRHVVSHLPASTHTFLRDLLPEHTVHTAHTHSPQRKADCDRLREAVRAIGKADPHRTNPRARKLDDLRALASFQFGPVVADALTDGVEAKGRWPFVKLLRGDTQIGMVTEGRGLLSLTLEGAAVLAEHGTRRVHIQDFPIRKTGSLFAVGVTSADPDIRPGDDVAVVCGGELRAVGVAQMAADEMAAMTRGVAVNLRHVAAAAKQPAPAPAPAGAAAEKEVTA